MAATINSPVNSTAQHLAKDVVSVGSLVIWRAVEVEQDDKDDSSNQILSMKTTVKKLRIRVVINNLRLEIFLPCKARC